MGTNNALNERNTGIQSFVSGTSIQGRTITGTTNEVSLSNGDGTAGNPTVSLTSNIYVTGISFNSGTNTLSIYSEGTWSPALSTSGTTPTITYNNQVGRYTQIGHQVWLSGYININTYTGGTGNVFYGVLPFSSGATTNESYCTPVSYSTVTFGGSVKYATGVINAGSSDMAAQTFHSASGAVQLTVTAFAANSIINFSNWYSTA